MILGWILIQKIKKIFAQILTHTNTWKLEQYITYILRLSLVLFNVNYVKMVGFSSDGLFCLYSGNPDHNSIKHEINREEYRKQTERIKWRCERPTSHESGCCARLLKPVWRVCKWEEWLLRPSNADARTPQEDINVCVSLALRYTPFQTI